MEGAFQPIPIGRPDSNKRLALFNCSVAYSSGSHLSESSEASLSLGSEDLPTDEHIEIAHSDSDVDLGDPAGVSLSHFDMNSIESFSPISIGPPTPSSSVCNIFSSDSDALDAVAAAPLDASGEQLNDNHHGAGSAKSEQSESLAAASQSSRPSVQASTASTLFVQGYPSPPITPPTPPYQPSDPGAPLTLTQAQQAYPSPPPTPAAYTQLPTGYLAYEPDEGPSPDNRPRLSLFEDSVNKRFALVFCARSQPASPPRRKTSYGISASTRRCHSEPPSLKRDIVFVDPLTQEDFVGIGSDAGHCNSRYYSAPKRQRVEGL